MTHGSKRWLRSGIVPGVLAGLVAAAGATALALAAGGNLPDFSLSKGYDPAGGAFDRDTASRVALTLFVDGDPSSAPIAWRIRSATETIAERDTIVTPPRRPRERLLMLPIPPLPPGSYALDVIADPEGKIEERDEGNNQRTYGLQIPDGAPVLFRCEGPEGSSWEIQRLELNTSTGKPYPNEWGTRADTSRSSEKEILVHGIEPGGYLGVLFGPSVNRSPILVSNGSFEMPDPPQQETVVWKRTTPYMVNRPKIHGNVAVTTGALDGAPRWKNNTRVTLEGSIRNPTDRSSDVQWLLRFLEADGQGEAARDTLLTLGALATERVILASRIPRTPGKYLVQAEVRVPWPTSFEDLGEEDRVASHVLPLGFIEVEP
ncbi:MAG: hypothetical protein QUU85_19215 [Candidatus Eisenbacteria bacterium]|nr:hypothetical protein [Candidatus Eisenbacteria bacterium]